MYGVVFRGRRYDTGDKLSYLKACVQLAVDSDDLGPGLRERGHFFVGLDVIGGWLTEINVTSPTGIMEANALDGQEYETRVIMALERKIE